MECVYLLDHVYEKDGEEVVKFIGAFSSEENAKAVVGKLKNMRGFNRFPEECFVVSRCIVDQYGWSDGFIDWDEALKRDS